MLEFNLNSKPNFYKIGVYSFKKIIFLDFYYFYMIHIQNNNKFY